MIEAVVLGVRGVLLPWGAFWEAGIDAVAASLGPLGLPAEKFRSAARRRLETSGPRGLISRSLKDLQLVVPSAVEREAVVTARSAVPSVVRDESLLERMRDLAARVRFGFLDDGHPDVLEELIARLGLDSLPEKVLWTRRLGRTAAPPRAFGFRWLAERFGLRPDGCLHVAGCGATRLAARRAGWKAWPERGHTSESAESPDSGAFTDWPDLLEHLDEPSGDGSV